MKNTSRTNRSILAALAVVVGLFMIAVAPFLIQTSLERVLVERLLERAEVELARLVAQLAEGAEPPVKMNENFLGL